MRLPQQAEEEEPWVLQLWRFEPLHRRLPQEVRQWPEQQPRLLPHRHRDEGGSNKERRHHKHRSSDRGGRFDKESLKKCFQYKAKKREKAFLAQLSDLDKSSDTDRSSSPTSDDNDKKKKKNYVSRFDKTIYNLERREYMMRRDV